MSEGDTLRVALYGSIYDIKNSEIAEQYYQLSEKYLILKTPFSGINYTSKTNYSEIFKEINRYRDNRLNFIQNQKQFFPELELIVQYRYVSELLSPLNRFQFSEIVVPIEYKNNIDQAIENLPSIQTIEKNIDLVKQYYWGILKYQILNKGLNSPEEKLDLIDNYFNNNYLKNYLVWRLYKLENLIPESKKVYQSYFSQISDQDYIKTINESENSWGKF